MSYLVCGGAARAETIPGMRVLRPTEGLGESGKDFVWIEGYWAPQGHHSPYAPALSGDTFAGGGGGHPVYPEPAGPYFDYDDADLYRGTSRAPGEVDRGEASAAAVWGGGGVRRMRMSGEGKQSSRTDWSRIDAMRDKDIDTSDVPPLDEGFFREAEVRVP